MPGVRVATNKKEFSLEGGGGVDSVSEGGGKWRFGGAKFSAAHIRYVIPGADESVHISGLLLDSKLRLLRMDTVRIRSTGDKEAIGRAKGHQVDVVDATSEGIAVEGLGYKGVVPASVGSGQNNGAQE